jgi:hypothetical protein
VDQADVLLQGVKLNTSLNPPFLLHAAVILSRPVQIFSGVESEEQAEDEANEERGGEGVFGHGSGQESEWQTWQK